ncbi:hypothetical protein N9A28_04805 [Sulfurimonas sp.]|nr:hypothetical protein [Sulfurimonas sp.]
MSQRTKRVLDLIDFVRMDKFYVVCHFKCKIKDKVVVSTVPFEPYEGKIELTWDEILFSPIESYKRYYHTPITIYSKDCSDTIVLKAFEKVANYFVWNHKEQKYIYN